ncbi:hypothetical protein AWH63_10535 [Marinobacter sp. C18]|uniref:hypothetical protein n=1 Tax=Marinobacter sp. C18 TaxID=1772288 RepID=UPI0009490AF8|nr:hypothetical protein [Marinobacter sp. C18]OLF81967.1 hypothetical protein AWH63_10535 [Marinobacter sp. C18]
MIESKTAPNTHELYNTVGHEHLDALVYWALGDFPDSGINLVECENGKWFVKVDHGDDYDHLEGIARPNVSPLTEPTFFSTEDAAREFAYKCIRMVHPELIEVDFDAYYSDDD